MAVPHAHFQAALGDGQAGGGIGPNTILCVGRGLPARAANTPMLSDSRSLRERHAVTSWMSSGIGCGGRPMDDIPDMVVSEIRRYIAQHGCEPSSNWIYRRTRELFADRWL